MSCHLPSSMQQRQIPAQAHAWRPVATQPLTLSRCSRCMCVLPDRPVPGPSSGRAQWAGPCRASAPSTEPASPPSKGAAAAGGWSQRLLGIAKRKQKAAADEQEQGQSKQKKAVVSEVFQGHARRTAGSPAWQEQGEFLGDAEEDEDMDEGPQEKRLPAEMRCFDTARIYVKSGDGGNGCVAFRREKFVEFGGPAGGNGGKGGNVWVQVDERLNSLTCFRTRVHWRAEDGGNGQGSSMHGADSDDLIIPVPAGEAVWWFWVWDLQGEGHDSGMLPSHPWVEQGNSLL